MPTFDADIDIVVWSLALTVVILAVALIFHDRKIKRILKGKTGKDLEDSFRAIEKEYVAMKNFRDAMCKYLEEVETRLKGSVRGVGVVRFNPWKGTGDGGNQSFASAFLSEKGDGVIISSLNSRDRVSVFAKPVQDGKSSYELTGEEKEALKKALDKTLEK